MKYYLKNDSLDNNTKEMKRKFQSLLMLAFILASHVNHVATTISTSQPLPEVALTSKNTITDPKPRSLRRRKHHHRRHHRKKRNYRHKKSNLQMTYPYQQNYQSAMMTPMGYGYPNMMNNMQRHRNLFGGLLSGVTSAVGGAAGGALGGAGDAVGGLIGGVGDGAGQAIEGAGEGAGGVADGVGSAASSVGGAIDGVGDSVGSALGMGDNAGTGLAVGAAAAGAGYMMRKKRQKEHAAKVRMLDQKIAMKEFQSNLVDQEYQLLVHANRDLHAANGRVSNLERNAVYRINARILDYAIGAYY